MQNLKTQYIKHLELGFQQRQNTHQAMEMFEINARIFNLKLVMNQNYVGLEMPTIGCQ
jgi:hypothetical protein